MELKEAIEATKIVRDSLKDFPNSYEILDTLLKGVEELQKENEKLKANQEEFMNEYHKRVQERIDIEQELKDSISKDKIKEKIEEIKSWMNDDCLALHEFQREAQIDVLQELLKGE